MDLLSLWTLTFAKGYSIRQNNENGKQLWEELEAKYSKYPMKIPLLDNLKALSKSINYQEGDQERHRAATIKISDITLNNAQSDKNKDHFFIQHFRIPIMNNYDLNVPQLLQIAYNAGQFAVDVERGLHDPKIVEFYRKNKLSNITSYIDKSLINRNVDQQGGVNRMKRLKIY